MFAQEPPHTAVMRTYTQAPPKGSPESVALPGTEQPGRSKIYRHWKTGSGELLKTLDPKVRIRIAETTG